MAGKKSGGKAPAKAPEVQKTPEQLAQEAEKKRQKAAYDAAPGTVRHAAVCGDGISIANFEKMSQAKSGKSTLQEWRDAVVDALKNAKEGDKTYAYKGNDTISASQAKMFNEVGAALAGDTPGTTKYESTAQLENLLTGKIKGLEKFGNIDPSQVNNPKYSGWTNYYPTHRMPMWRYLYEKGLADQAFWQHETTVSFVGANKEKIYVDPTEIPYVVSNAGTPGSFVKVTAPNGNSTYARILEAGTEYAESSLKTWKNLGYDNVTTKAAPAGTLKVEPLGGGALPKAASARSAETYFFNNDEIQRAGKLLEKGYKIDTRDDLRAAEAKEQQKQGQQQQQQQQTSASADPAVPAGGGGPRLEKGFQTVAIGKNMRRVGYACEQCTHEAGGYVLQGSATVYVGKYPFSRIGDMTSDELAVETGDETVLIGGAPSSAQLA